MENAVAVIGDLVGSRTAGDRAWVQEQLLSALQIANAEVDARQPLAPTIGDEFQAVYATVEDALAATLLVRLALPAPLDARFGLGAGDLEIVGATAYGLTQDGPAWWAAREAVDHVEQRAGRVPGARTWIEGEPMTVAYALCRDQVVTALDDRQKRIALGLLRGHTQKQIAQDEAITPSAVSQHVRGAGIAALVAAAQELRR